MLVGPRTQPFAQLLLGVATLVVVIGVVVVSPSKLGVAAFVGAGVILAGCIAMVLIWLSKTTRGSVWIAVVPLIDIAACIPIRAAAQGVLPGAGFIVLFPVGWLAFAFPLWFLVAGLSVTTVIPVTDLLQADALLDGPSGWVTTLVLPILMALYATAIAVIARELRLQRRTASDARTRMSDALRSSAANEATVRALGDATLDAFVVFDSDAKPLLINSVAEQWIHRARIPASIDDASEAEVYAADRTTRLPIGPSVFQRLVEGEFISPREVWVGPADDQIAVRFTGRPVIADGVIVAFVLIGADVTELRRAVDVRDRFLDSVGHELRSPLTVILGNAQLAVDEAPDRAHGRWEVIDRSAERLLHLVERLITAGRKDSAFRTAIVDATAVVRSALDPVSSLAEERAVDFAVIGEPEAHARIAERDLAAIVHELATNAVRFTPAGGSVVVDTRPEGTDAILVEITDTGVGMTADERSQAFDRFFRGAHAYAAAVQGAGLGLSIAKRLAASHDATITLIPHAAGGTIATLRLRSASATPVRVEVGL